MKERNLQYQRKLQERVAPEAKQIEERKMKIDLGIFFWKKKLLRAVRGINWVAVTYGYDTSNFTLLIVKLNHVVWAISPNQIFASGEHVSFWVG